jgi:hypothetical protein
MRMMGGGVCPGLESCELRGVVVHHGLLEFGFWGLLPNDRQTFVNLPMRWTCVE